MSTQTVIAGDAGQRVDPVEEFRLRAWARTHYLPESERTGSLHPIVLDEMHRKDAELSRRPRPR